MSDYLSNLVGKSLGLTDMLLPRPVSVFESLQPSGTFAGDEYSLEERVEGRRRPGNPRIPADETVPTPKAESTEQPPSHSNPEIEFVRPRPLRDLDYKPGESTLLIPHQSALPERVSGDGGRQAAGSRLTTDDDDPSPGIEQSTAPPDRFIGAWEATSAFTPRTLARETVVPESIAVASSTLLIPPRNAPDVIDHDRDDSSSEHARPVRISDTIEQEAPPTVKITIGRVDVRAVMPERQPPSPRPERRNLTLSLDEYLKQRSGGKS